MRDILFVDDEAAILAGLRRMLHPMRSQWRMRFAADATSALGMLDLEAADVVVSDMRMPGIDGATLLGEVRRRWPGTVRMILSGFADQGAALRSVPVAHQFLSKPCDSATLKTRVGGACDLRERLAHPELRMLIGELGALPSAPRSFAAITEALERRDACPERVSSLIEQDVGATAKLLQMVNSAFFGLPRAVTRVSEAVAYLGIPKVRDVVLVAEVADMSRHCTPALAGITEELNEHAAAVAVAARSRVERVEPGLGQDAFVAGVLHDIGRLALATVVPDTYAALESDHRRNGVDLPRLEKQQLGATHAEIGAYLLSLWGLPGRLVNAVARHHDVGGDRDGDPVAAAVAAAVAAVDAGPR
jgi:HD-like signal output (HDOD) protein